jgi:hypothetical protein
MRHSALVGNTKTGLGLAWRVLRWFQARVLKGGTAGRGLPMRCALLLPIRATVHATAKVRRLGESVPPLGAMPGQTKPRATVARAAAGCDQ